MTKTVTTGKATDLITFARSTTGTYLGSDGLLRTADTNEPRIEYDADGNLKGLLIEEQRTNAMLNSGSITNWTKTNVTMTDSVAVAPDGTVTADKAQRTDPNTLADYRQSLPVTAGNDYTFSVFAKADAPARIELDFSNSRFTANDYARFDVDTGTAYDSGTGATYSITDYGNGWYRFSLTATCTASGSTGVIVRVINDEPHYAWGGQFEQGSFPTSYIPTSGSTVTRNADVANVNLSTFELNQNESTLFVSGTSMPTRDVGTVKEFWCASLHTASGYANMRFYSGGVANSAVQDAVGFDGGVQFDATGATISPPVEFSSVLAIKDNDVGYANQSMTGVNIDTSSTFSDFNNLRIGSTGSGSYLNGHVQSVKYYPVRLTNNQLKALTQ